MKKRFLAVLCALALVMCSSCGLAEAVQNVSGYTDEGSNAGDKSSGLKEQSAASKEPSAAKSEDTAKSQTSVKESSGKTVELGKADVGDCVTFGTFEQDNDTTNGAEPIEWLVIAKENGALMLISKYILYCNTYNGSSSKNVTWETCSLRTWLNIYFHDNAFNEAEKLKIATTSVVNEDSPAGGLGGEDTEDKIYLLSFNEVDKYLTKDQAKGHFTAYAENQQTFLKKNGAWWLRTAGANNKRAAFVYQDGGHYSEGGGLDMDNMGVRPVLWVVP